MSFPSGERIAIGLIYLIFGGAGVLANGATFLTFLSCEEFHSSPYFWMTGIAFADMWMCLVIGVYAGCRVLTLSTGGAVVEAAVSFIDHTAWYVMLTFFNGLDANRFLVLCLRPNHPWAVRSQNKTVTLCLMIVTTLIIIVFTIYLINVAHYPQLSFVFYDQIYTFNYNTSTPAGALGSRINVIYDAVCLTIQFLSQAAVLCKVRNIRRNVTRNREFSSYNPRSPNYSRCTSATLSSDHHSTDEKKLERKRVSAAHQQQIDIFFLCLGPNIVIILNTIAFFSVPSIAPYMSPWHVSLFHIFWLFQHSCNPLFYCLFNGQLRAKWKEVFCCCITGTKQFNGSNLLELPIRTNPNRTDSINIYVNPHSSQTTPRDSSGIFEDTRDLISPNFAHCSLDYGTVNDG